MAKRGRKPLPIESHLKRGSYRRDRHGPPIPPHYLSFESKAWWKELEEFPMSPRLWDRALAVCLVHEDFYKALFSEDSEKDK